MGKREEGDPFEGLERVSRVCEDRTTSHCLAFSLDTRRSGAICPQPSSLTDGGSQSEFLFIYSISTDRLFVGLQRVAPERLVNSV